MTVFPVPARFRMSTRRRPWLKTALPGYSTTGWGSRNCKSIGFLDATGAVLSVSVQKSSGNVDFDESAPKAARMSTYAPEIVNCKKTAGAYLFTADFKRQ